MMVFPPTRSVKLACVLAVLCVALTASCTKKGEEKPYSKEEMFGLAPHEGQDKLEIVLAKDINDAIPCAHYGEGCASAHRVRARGLDFIAVEFGSKSQAKQGARKVRGWSAHNWLFDDVEGEPQLERWVEKHYQGERFTPREKAQDSPEKLPGNG